MLQRLSALAFVFFLALPGLPGAASAVPGAPAAVPGAPGTDAPAERPRIGLVLSGGGARGIAHVGVLKVLEEMRVPVDVITGTSMGAVIGSLYASGYSPAELEEIVTTTDWPDAFEDDTPRRELSFRRKEDDLDFLTSARFGIRDGSVALPAGFIQGQKLNLFLRRLLLRTTALEDFDELHLPFRAVSTNLVDGREVVHASGDVATAVRASMSIPGAFQPVEMGDMLLVDGMLVNNIPIALAFELGADVVIAVDVGAPLRKREEIRDAVSVADQVLTIATDRMADRQRRLLRPRDLLLVPALAGIGAADFERSGEIVPIGEAAARGAAARLRELAVPDARWRAYLARQRHDRGDVPTIDRVEFAGDAEPPGSQVRSRIEAQAGHPLDVATLERDLAEIHGRDVFDHVDYQLREDGAQTVLEIETHEKPWGPHYVRVGFNLEENFDNTSVYNLALSYTLNPANALGGEWRNELQLGNTLRIFSEFWQPLDRDSRWFVAPSLAFTRERVPLYEGRDRVAEFSLRRTELGFDLGRQIADWGEVRAGVEWQDGRSGPLIGARSFQGSEVDGGGIFLRLAADTLDDANFPRLGVFARLTLASRHRSFGAATNSELVQLRIAAAHSWGRQSFVFSLDGLTQFGKDEDRIENLTRVGGFLDLSGLDRGQLSGPHSLVVRAVTYRRLADFGLLNFRFPVYVGASVELGNVWENRSDISVGSALAAGSLFFGWRTPLGPMYIGYGAAENGQASAYLFLGNTF